MAKVDGPLFKNTGKHVEDLIKEGVLQVGMTAKYIKEKAKNLLRDVVEEAEAEAPTTSEEAAEETKPLIWYTYDDDARIDTPECALDCYERTFVGNKGIALDYDNDGKPFIIAYTK